jgi:hypothetical protein
MQGYEWVGRFGSVNCFRFAGVTSISRIWMQVTRSIWHRVVGNCKTEASAKPVPMDSYMAEYLLRWRRQRDFATDDDYVFASETMKGKQTKPPEERVGASVYCPNVR